MAMRKVLAASLLAASLGVGGLGAAEAVTFYYDSYGGFTPGTDSPASSGTFVNDADTQTGGAFDVGADPDARAPAPGHYVNVTWGTPTGSGGPYGGKSGFALSKVNDTPVDVGGGEVVFGKLTHFNQPISSGTDLEYVQMDWNLQLFDTLADAQGNTGAFQTISLAFTLYNWETPNNPNDNPVYQVSYDNGATWVAYGPDLCPGSTPAGTLIQGPLGKIYQSANADNPGNPVWNGECADAHIYEGSASNVYTFTRGGRLFRIELIGFYGPTGALTQTFWACEQQQCFGTVNFVITDITAADLVIAKTDGVTSINAGSATTYTVTVTNNGPSELTGVVVTDPAPTGVTLGAWSCAVTSVGAGGVITTACGAASGSGPLNTTADFKVGGQVTYTIAAVVTATGGSVTNAASVAPPAGYPNPGTSCTTQEAPNARSFDSELGGGTCTAFDTDTVIPTADLAVTKTDNVSSVTAGTATTYTIVVSNTGPSNATGALVTDNIPPQLASWAWACTGATGGATGCDPAASSASNFSDTVNLPADSSITYTVSAVIAADATGTLTNTVTVSTPSGVTEPTPTNNSATDTDTITTTAELSITKTDGLTDVVNGQTVTYTVVLTNNGPSAGNGTVVTDPIAAGLTKTGTPTCVPSGGAVCPPQGLGPGQLSIANLEAAGVVIPTLPVGGSVTFTVQATVDALEGSVTNTVNTTQVTGAPGPSASDTDTVYALAVTEEIPTLGEYALIALMLLLAAAGGIAARRVRRA